MLHAKYNGYDVHLIEDVSEFEVIKKLCSKKVDAGVDTETSGLNITDTIAGVCLSCGHGYQPGQYHGFYLPIRHIGYKNNLPITAVMELTMWIVNNFKTVWWNRDYDFNMLERDGCELPNCGATHDAQCMAHLVKGDPFPALKDFAHDYCKLEVIHFSDNNAENNNFQLTDPTVTFKYAAQDPIITVLVARKLWAEYPHIRKVYPIDNRFAECMRRVMNNTDLYLDLNIVNQQLNKVTSELAAIKQQIFSFTGYQFRLTSNKDIADALSRYVTLTAKTKKGAWDVSKDVLQELDTPLASMILKFKHLEKFRSTYLEKMAKFPQPFHINYQHANVATGRLSSGSSKGNDFFAPFNIQNVPKVEIFRYLHYAPESSPIKWVLDDSPYCSLADGMMVMMSDGTSKPLRDVKVGEQVMTNKGAKGVLDCGELNTVLKPYEGTRMNKSGEWKFVTFYPEDSKTWFIDLGDDVYSIKSSNCDIQIRTLQKMKCKGGMRDCFVCPEGYVWLSADYCIDPEANIITNRGNVKMKDMRDGMLVYTPWGYKPCKNVRSTGRKQVVRIKLKSGEELKCSAEHPICVKRDGKIQWVKAGSLSKTDYVFSINNTKYLTNNGITSADISEN